MVPLFFSFGILWWLIILGVILVPIVLLIILLAKIGKSSTASSGKPKAGKLDRAATFRKRKEAFEEEQGRILGMVGSGKISAGEGDRLFETLARETSIMACPLCNEDISIEAVKCKHCGSFLYEGISGPRRLTKSHDKMLAGVCGGLAEYLDMDPGTLRILVALLIFFTGIVTGLIVYVVAAVILPDPA